MPRDTSIKPLSPAYRYVCVQSSNSTLVDPAQRKAVVATLDRYRKAWAGRKAMVTEVCVILSVFRTARIRILRV